MNGSKSPEAVQRHGIRNGVRDKKTRPPRQPFLSRIHVTYIIHGTLLRKFERRHKGRLKARVPKKAMAMAGSVRPRKGSDNNGPALAWRVSRPIPFESRRARRLSRTSVAGGSIPFMFRDAQRTLIGGRERERAG